MNRKYLIEKEINRLVKNKYAFEGSNLSGMIYLVK